MIKIEEAHSMDVYLNLLNESRTIYIDEEQLRISRRDAQQRVYDLKSITTLWLRIESGGDFNNLTRETLSKVLEYSGVDINRYANKKTGNISLDMKKVIQPLIDKGVLPELLSAYKDYKSYLTYVSFLDSLWNTRKKGKLWTDGRYVIPYPTQIIERDNLRTYYSDIAVVSIPKIYSNIVTTKDENHYLAWCDYPQADWRFAYNLFIRDTDNFKYMDCDDAYEGLARLVQGDSFDEEAFKEQRKEFKVNCLSVFYNSKNPKEIPTAIRKFFYSCPKYRQYVEDLYLLYKFKLPIPCTSYFGFEQLLPEGAYPDAFVSKGLNTPIQTFTSHIVMETVFNLLQKFWNLGYTKDDINIYYVRHDEPIFMFSPSILKDAWVFKECSEIYIPGFTPIKLNFNFGKRYKEDDALITRQVTESIESSTHTYDVFTEGHIKDYYPIPKVESVSVQFFACKEDCIGLAVYRYKDQKWYLVPTTLTDLHEVLDEGLSAFIHDVVSDLKYLYVRTEAFNETYVLGENDTIVKFVISPDSDLKLQKERSVLLGKR